MTKESCKIVEWAVKDLVPHPDNPRTIRVNTVKFQELLDSIKANGVLEPLTVRIRSGVMPELPTREVLSGHRRLTAAKMAGLASVPVIDLGEVVDDIAYDIVAMTNLHEGLTPLEEGKWAALWLDKYHEDAKAVAAKLGQTPRWVVEHAQIYRNLSADWQKAAAERSMFDRWTSSHWAVIAKLPRALQAQILSRLTNGAFCSFDRWSVAELEKRIGHKTFLLAKAPFPRESCAACPNRTGQQPLFLWSDTPEGATGDQERCLDAKCWQHKCEKAERDAFRRIAEEKGLENPLPLCLLKEPKNGWGREYDEWRAAVSACRRANKGLLTAGQVKMVKETTPGAVPAIVVAGVGKGSVKWVKPQEKKEDSPGRSGGPREPTAKETARERERIRGRRALDRLTERLFAAPCPSAAAILYLWLFMEPVDLYGPQWEASQERIVQLLKTRDWRGFEKALCEAIWKKMTQRGAGHVFWSDEGETILDAVCPVLELDKETIYAEIDAEDERKEKLASGTQVVKLDLPAKLNASCELRVVEVGGKWFAGFRLAIPKASADLPVATDGDEYEAKDLAVKAMAEACGKHLAKWKGKKKCPQALYAAISTEINRVLGACEVERLRRVGIHESPCEGCTLTDAANTSSGARPVRPFGLIECPEKIRVPTEKVWKAMVTIKIAQVDGKWCVGWDAHVPKAGECVPCTTANPGYSSRDDALAFARDRLEAWLDGAPGRRSYKYHDELKTAIRAAVAGTSLNAAAKDHQSQIMNRKCRTE